MNDLEKFRKRAIELFESIVESADAGAFGEDFVWSSDAYATGCSVECTCVICAVRDVLRDDGILDRVPRNPEEKSDGE